jgi:glycosyltransferase involved in cell wall biosynthesis
MTRDGPGQKAEAPGRPWLTVVTVARNAAAHIRQTIESVLDQTAPGVEYVVVDGASTDGTAAVIREYGDRLAAWVSEPDRGIAEAMNKGLALSSGELVLFLHADDFLVDEQALARAAEAVREEDADIYTFDILYGRAGRLERRRPRGFTWHMSLKTGVYHQGALCRRGLFESLGGFDPGLAVAMDYDFFLRAYRAGARLTRVPRVLAVMRDSGVSSQRDWRHVRVRLSEERQIHERHRQGAASARAYSLYWGLYLPYRWLRARFVDASTARGPGAAQGAPAGAEIHPDRTSGG